MFVRDPATTGLNDFILYGIWPPRYSPRRDVATTGRNGILLNGTMQPRRDSTGLFIRDPATAGLASNSLVSVHAMSVRAVCACRLLRARTPLGSLNTKEKGFFGVRGVVLGGEGDSH